MSRDKKRSSLGSGIDALFKGNTEDISVISATQNAVIEVNINDIEPGIGQPRKNFNDEKISQLAESIKEHGVIQPLIVRKEGRIYKIIAGERRWRASRLAGLTKVPVIEKDATDREVLEMALIENIQREDLNPIEEAEAYKRLMSEYDLTQEDLSQVISKSRSAISNRIRLLDLPTDISAMVSTGELSEGHARALLGIKDEAQLKKAAQTVINSGLNVRQTETLVKKIETETPPIQKEKPSDEYKLAIRSIEKKLTEHYKAAVKLVDNGGKGKITITFCDSDERERIIHQLLSEE